MEQVPDSPVIVEVAVNGVTQKSRNPHVPITIDEIVEDALACFDAGAQIVHQHDDLGSEGGRLGSATPEEMAAKSAAVYRAVLSKVPDAILYPTTNWSHSLEQRWRHQEILAEQGLLRMAFLDPGSVNLGGLGSDELPAGDFVYDHHFDYVKGLFRKATSLNLSPSMAIFEPGFLRTAIAYERAGCLPPGAFAKIYFSDRLVFGFPPIRPALDAYLALLKGSRIPWAVAVLGGDVLGSGMARWALGAGGHVRVGLEDYSGPACPTNRELVEGAVALCEEIGRPVASREQVVQLLGMPR